MYPYLGIRYQIKYHKCNLDCPYCIVSCNQQQDQFNESTYLEIINKIKQLPYRVSLRLGFEGEFFTSKQLMDSVKNICNTESNIFNVSFSTNLAADWDKVIEPFLKSVNTQKLGIGCTLHDTVIKDVDEFFEKARNIKKTGAEIYIGHVALPGRLKIIAGYKKRCEDLGIPLIMNGLIGKLVGIEGADPSLEYPKAYTKRELKELKKLWDTPHSYKLLLEACQTKGMVCSAGKNYIFIDNEGNVSPCQLFTKRMGNILSESIMFQAEDAICPVPVCWCGNENQALRIVDEKYVRSNTLRIFKPKESIPKQQLYEGYNPSIYNSAETNHSFITKSKSFITKLFTKFRPKYQ